MAIAEFSKFAGILSEGRNEKLELADVSFYTERKLLHRMGKQRGSIV